MYQVSPKLLEEIIFSLRQSKEDYLATIFEDLGKISEDELILNLQRTNSSLDIDEEDLAKSRKFICIGKHNFEVKLIYVFEKDQEYNHHTNKEEFFIILNPTTIGGFKGNIADKRISFETQEERDKEYNLLIKKLKKLDIIFL